MMELSSGNVMNKEKVNNGSHSLPEYWNSQRLRLQTTFPCSTVNAPSLSTALISSSTESSEDYEEDWPWIETSSFEGRLRRESDLRSVLSGLFRRPSAPVWIKLTRIMYFFIQTRERGHGFWYWWIDQSIN